MKHIILLCDGMADTPCPALGGMTPMEAADKPLMDALAARSEMGMVKTVPDGMFPGSDVANLSVLGYDPAACYTGRSPLEAANLGISLADDDLAFRCNLVTLSDAESYDDRTMEDYCGGDISTAEAAQLIEAVQQAFGGGEFNFTPGTAYRHCLVWHGGALEEKLTPPHDIPGQRIGEHLCRLSAFAPLLDMMKRSIAVLDDHPINRERRAKGLRPANAIWLWGQGRRPKLDLFTDLFGLKGAMVSAVDLLKGIARLADMQVCEVPGATGYIDTDFEGKAAAAVKALKSGCDLVYIHVEAPDECGHRGEAENKKRSIEMIDRRLLKPLLEQLDGDYSLMILPDHPTPLAIRTHSAAPVPYLLYRSNAEKMSGAVRFTEKEAAATGIAIADGTSLMRKLIG